MPHIESDIQDLYQKWLSAPSPALCVRLAGKLRHSGRNTEALEVARKGLKSWPDNISVNVVFGRCALNEKLKDEALEVFQKVISIDPLNLIAIRSLAEIYYEKEKWNRSIELFEEYLFEYPGDPEIESILKKAKERKKEAEREARVTGQNVTYPTNDRMASILAAQKKTESADKATPLKNEKQIPAETNASTDNSSRAPRSLFNLFSSEECQELGLSPFDK